MDYKNEAENVLKQLREEHNDMLFEMELCESFRGRKLVKYSFSKGEIEDNIMFDFGFEMPEEARYNNVNEAVVRNIDILEREPAEGV